MYNDLSLIDYRTRERALETAAAHRRAREARNPSAPLPTGGLRRRLMRVLHRR